jgi:transposase InsO family protein
MTCPMSREGNCWDNDVAESLWATIKRELTEANNGPQEKRSPLRCSNTWRSSTTSQEYKTEPEGTARHINRVTTKPGDPHPGLAIKPLSRL